MKLITFLILLISLPLVQVFAVVELDEQNIGIISQEVVVNTQKVEDLFAINQNFLIANDVIELSTKIIKSRERYTKNTLAKVFILLANVADNQSDYQRSFQFANDGLMLSTIDVPLKINLLLKVASGYYEKGQFPKVLETANLTISLAQQIDDTQYLLLGLAYRSMAYALLSQYDQAFNDLIEVESIIEKNVNFSDNIDLLKIISTAHFYLGEYQTALTINHKLLKLYFDLSLTSEYGQIYFRLARCYHRLGLLDDAYNAYWESKKYAKDSPTQINLGYAELGLGEILFLQKDYVASYDSLTRAEEIFSESRLTKPYISTVIALVKVNLLTKNVDAAYELLTKAEVFMKNVELVHEQYELLILLSDMHTSKQNYLKALGYLNQYIVINKHFVDNKVSNILTRNMTIPEQDKNKQLAIKLAEKTELSSTYTKKYQRQQFVIIILITFLAVVFLMLVIGAFRQRSKQMNKQYDEIERPTYSLASPVQTKQIYQCAYKKARKYQYPITVGYISIDNWRELSFKFNKRTLAEVSKTLATLINEHISEFEHAGLINHGEYLLLYPHQNLSDADSSFEQLKDALNVRFFAALGDFSVNMSFALSTPSVQDIDPYIFLSRLSEIAAPKSTPIDFINRRSGSEQ